MQKNKAKAFNCCCFSVMTEKNQCGINWKSSTIETFLFQTRLKPDPKEMGVFTWAHKVKRYVFFCQTKIACSALDFSALICVLMSGILIPPFDVLWITIDLFILSRFLSHTNSKHSFWASLINLSGGLGSMTNRYTNLDRIDGLSTATLPSGVIVRFAHILNFFFSSQ